MYWNVHASGNSQSEHNLNSLIYIAFKYVRNLSISPVLNPAPEKKGYS